MLLSECRITHRQPSEQPEVCRRFTEDPCCRRSSDGFPPFCNDFSLSSAVFARIDPQTPETVLAQAAFDDPAPVANGAEIRFGLDGWPKAPRSFQRGTAPAAVLRVRATIES